MVREILQPLDVGYHGGVKAGYHKLAAEVANLRHDGHNRIPPLGRRRGDCGGYGSSKIKTLVSLLHKTVPIVAGAPIVVDLQHYEVVVSPVGPTPKRWSKLGGLLVIVYLLMMC